MTDLAATTLAALTLAPTQYVRVDRQPDPEPVVVFAMIIAAILVLVALRARYRLAVKRLELLRELAASGHLTPRGLEDQLRPKRPWLSVVLVAAWFGMFGGVALSILGAMNDFRGDFGEMGAFGIFLLLTSLATITAPLALREMRRGSAAP